jgi:hypothetical protein
MNNQWDADGLLHVEHIHVCIHCSIVYKEIHQRVINQHEYNLAKGQKRLNFGINISSGKATIQMKEAARLQRHHDNMRMQLVY